MTSHDLQQTLERAGIRSLRCEYQDGRWTVSAGNRSVTDRALTTAIVGLCALVGG